MLMVYLGGRIGDSTGRHTSKSRIFSGFGRTLGWQYFGEVYIGLAGLSSRKNFQSSRIPGLKPVLSPGRCCGISPLVKRMLSNDLIEVVHEYFGVLTNENGYLVRRDDDQFLPIAMLGRLAKGTIIGVDAILECFGPRPEKWASKAADNYFMWLDRKEKR